MPAYQSRAQPSGLTPVRVYPYHDAQGTPLFFVERYEGTENGGQKKSFKYWCRRNGQKRYTLADLPRPLPLYRLHEIRRAIERGLAPIYVCEGEKDADSVVEQAKLPATTMPMGAGKWQDAYAAYLLGATRVIVVADLDGPDAKSPYIGERHAQLVAASLARAGIPVELRQPATGKDVSDHLAAGKTLAELAAFVPPPPAGGAAGFRLLDDVEVESEPEPEWQLDRILPAGVFAVLYGASETGKSFVALDWSLSSATGRPWRGRSVKSGPVVYVAAEGWSGIKRRVRAWKQAREFVGRAGVQFLCGNLQLMERAEVEKFLATIRAKLGDQAPVLIVVDTLNQNMPGGDENSPKDMGLAIDGAQFLRRETGATVLLVHHPRKDDEVERGHSSLRNAADTMLRLIVADDDARVLACTKQKDWSPFEELRFSLVPLADSLVLSDPPLEGAMTLTPKRRKALDTLKEIVIDEGVPYSRWEKASGLKERTFALAAKALTTAGLVTKFGKGHAARYGLPQKLEDPDAPPF
jgi:hypothetical protein